MLASAAALALVAAQSAACVELPNAAAVLVEQSEICLDKSLAEPESFGTSQRLPVEEWCPGLAAALEDTPLPDGWRESFGEQAIPAQLMDLSALLRGFRARPAAVPFQPDLARLDALLEETLEARQDEGWWSRFLLWLQKKIDKHRDSEMGHLLERLAGLLPPAWVVEVMVKGALVLLVLLALIVLLNVLRDEGVRDWWRSLFKPTGRQAAVSAGSAPQGSAWSEIASLPSSRQAGALLRYVIQALTRRGLLAPDRSRTNRELGRELTGKDRPTGDLFCRFADHAEPFVYGAKSPGDADLQKLRDDAGGLTRSGLPPATTGGSGT